MKALFFRILFWWLQPFDIKREGSGGEVYLRRFHVAKNRFFQIYVHNVRLPDDDPDPHDHPWSFLTLILKGGYTDENWLPSFSHPKLGELHLFPGGGGGYWDYLWGKMVQREPDVVRRGSIRFRRAEHIHRVRDVQPNTWTLVIGGRVRRMWGFWKKETGQWVKWREYLGIPEDREYKGD